MNTSRQKKKTIESQIDYSKCLFQIRVFKSGFFTKTHYILYAQPGQMIICTKPYDKKPHKIIDLMKNWKVKFLEDEKKQHLRHFTERAVGFRLIDSFVKDKESLQIEYFADGFAVVQMKDYFAREVFLTGFYNDFDIMEKLGQGKYAKVYRIVHKETGEEQAVKYMYKKKLKAQDVGEDALLNELSILRTLDHPNIIKHIGSYEDENGYYIVTELLDDEHCLHKEVKKFKETKFDYDVAKIIIKQLLQGIDYLHKRGIMHRDLKPHNIMFEKKKGSTTANYNALKIIDFGLAQYYNDPKFIYVHVGTPGYVAPEILADERPTHRYGEKCDIFSLGIILHLLLTGKQVFEGTQFKQVLELNKKCRFKFSGQQYDEINYRAINLLMKMLDPNPNTRISAEEALDHEFFKDDQIIKRRRRASQDQGIGAKLDTTDMELDTSDDESHHKSPGTPIKQEIMLNRNRANSLSHRQTGQKDGSELRNEIKLMRQNSEYKSPMKSPVKSPFGKVSNFQEGEVQEYLEEDTLPSPTKQNLGKNRNEILEMTLELLQYMLNISYKKQQSVKKNPLLYSPRVGVRDRDSSIGQVSHFNNGSISYRNLEATKSTQSINSSSHSQSVRVVSNNDSFFGKSKFGSNHDMKQQQQQSKDNSIDSKMKEEKTKQNKKGPEVKNEVQPQAPRGDRMKDFLTGSPMEGEKQFMTVVNEDEMEDIVSCTKQQKKPKIYLHKPSSGSSNNVKHQFDQLDQKDSVIGSKQEEQKHQQPENNYTFQEDEQQQSQQQQVMQQKSIQNSRDEKIQKQHEASQIVEYLDQIDLDLEIQKEQSIHKINNEIQEEEYQIHKDNQEIEQHQMEFRSSTKVQEILEAQTEEVKKEEMILEEEKKEDPPVPFVTPQKRRKTPSHLKLNNSNNKLEVPQQQENTNNNNMGISRPRKLSNAESDMMGESQGGNNQYIENSFTEMPFDQNILSNRFVKLMNFFPQQMFVQEKFEDKMWILGKFILFGTEWSDQNLSQIKKKIRILEQKVTYKKWVFDFLKNVFKLINEKNRDYVQLIKIDLPSCHSHFENNLKTKKKGGLLKQI